MDVQAHHVIRQVEYRGDVVSLTEALVGFPAGGQILLSDATYQGLYGRLHTLNFKDAGYTPAQKGTANSRVSCIKCQSVCFKTAQMLVLVQAVSICCVCAVIECISTYVMARLRSGHCMFVQMVIIAESALV